jgi:hypothetical protein
VYSPDIQAGMKFRAGCSFYAVNRPFFKMPRPGGVHIARCRNQIEPFHYTVNGGNNFIAAGNGKRTARAEVVLKVDNKQTVLFKHGEIFSV